MNNIPVKNYMSVETFCKKYLFIPTGGMRHLIFNRGENGYETAFKFMGRKVLIDVDEFFRIIDETSKLKKKFKNEK